MANRLAMATGKTATVSGLGISDGLENSTRLYTRS